MAGQDTGSPYTESRNGDCIIREFSKDVPVGDLIWHRDEHDRKIKIISGEGWQFQFDNQLPQDIVVEQIILVPKETYHRLLRGYTDLVLEITEHN